MAKLDNGVVVAERFRLERELGRGGMGTVWVAHHLTLDVPCALKFIDERGASDEMFRARFKQEAQAAAKLRHPNVVQVLDHGIWESIPYIAMELLEGETLAARLERMGRLTLRATWEIVAEVGLALTRAEELEIVHRDLKPENIFLVNQSGRDLVKVLDFGIAKLGRGRVGDAKTVTGAFVGTPQYASPEQVHGAKEVDHRSDLWSLGVITFECVTGRRPFEDDGMGQLLAAILTGTPPVPSQLVSSVPPDFDAWWARAAAREPAARFQSARELADALRAIVEGPGGSIVHAKTLPAMPPPDAKAPPSPTFAGEERVVAPRAAPRRSAVVAGVVIASLAVALAAYSMRGPPNASQGLGAPAAPSAAAVSGEDVPRASGASAAAASSAAPASASAAATAAASAPNDVRPRGPRAPTSTSTSTSKPKASGLEPGY